LPIALGEAAAPLGLAPAEVAQLYLQGFAANLCLIATRHIPLGQTEGQAVLARLLPDIVALGESAALADTADLGSATLAADLAAMQHETMDVRIFRT
jgi:urease accessory protein